MKLLAPQAEVAMRGDDLASADEIERFYEHLKTVFIDIQFLKESNPRRSCNECDDYLTGSI